jgi:hypothetical protein
MALTKKYIDTTNSTEETITTKLYLDQYNSNELSKSVNLQVTELIKPLPEIRLDLVPKPIYDTELSHSADLQIQVNMLTADVDSLKARVQALMADSSSLYLDNDNLRVQNAGLNNKLGSIQQTTLDLKSNLTTSLTKAINEATERTSLEAENTGLVAQKTALIKQIDTLNNLLAQANASLQVAAQQLSAKAQAVAAGGIATGELATIVFEKGDPTKLQGNLPRMMAADYGNGYDSMVKVAKTFGPAGGDWPKTYQSYFEVVAGPKDITIDVKFTEKVNQSIWDFGTLPISLKANQTKRFDMTKPSAYLNALPGQHGGDFWSHSSSTNYDFSFSIIVKDIDANGKTENKNFTYRLHNHN